MGNARGEAEKSRRRRQWRRWLSKGSPESLAEAVAVTLKPDRNTETFFCPHVSRPPPRKGLGYTVSLSEKENPV